MTERGKERRRTKRKERGE